MVNAIGLALFALDMERENEKSCQDIINHSRYLHWFIFTHWFTITNSYLGFYDYNWYYNYGSLFSLDDFRIN